MSPGPFVKPSPPHLLAKFHHETDDLCTVVRARSDTPASKHENKANAVSAACHAPRN
jgi:hypothetical protein